jgi:hypothetical protein
MIGSEDVIPWHGWPYDTIFTSLTANPTGDVAGIASNFVINIWITIIPMAPELKPFPF